MKKYFTTAYPHGYNLVKFTHIVRKRGLLRGIEPGAVFQFLITETVNLESVRRAIECRLTKYPNEEYSWDYKTERDLIAVRRDK